MKKFTKCAVRKYLKLIHSPKNRRALATVVTTAIIISAVSIMGVMLVGWANTNLFTKQANLESSFNDKMNKLNEHLVIQNIWFGSSPYVVNITLNNVGPIGLNVTEIEITNSTDTIIYTITDGGIAPSEDYSMEKTFVWNSSEIFDFTIFTNRGNQFTAQEVT
ncbi:hypothetical protein [Nitrosopumilus sp. S4]